MRRQRLTAGGALVASAAAKRGKRPTIHGLSILEIRDGRITRETIYSDHLRDRVLIDGVEEGMRS
jgi:hypothetical protein